MDEVTDIEVIQKWNKIPKELQQKILANVWCGQCKGSVTITDYTMIIEDFGLVIRGNCKVCGGKVARVIEEN